MKGRLAVVVPTYEPVGGVIKAFDYAVHGLELGWDVVVSAPERADANDAVWKVPRLSVLRPGGEVDHLAGLRVATGPRDVTMVSWPDHWLPVAERMEAATPHARLVHLIQNVRHANPQWRGGRPRLLLRRPMTRIYTNSLVEAACAPFAHQGSLAATIDLGHDTEPFRRARSGRPAGRIRVASVTWKSRIGPLVADHVGPTAGFEFRSLGGTVPWPELVELYQWADVFIAAPGTEEGFYLPGLEAMAAGAIVITPDAGGNMAYCRPDENCVLVGYGSVGDVADALARLAGLDAGAWEAIREDGYATAASHDLASERDGFGSLLDEVVRVPAKRLVM